VSPTANTLIGHLLQNLPQLLLNNDVVWCKEDPFGDKKCLILKFGGVCLPITLSCISS